MLKIIISKDYYIEKVTVLKKILISIILITVIAAGWTLVLRDQQIDQKENIEVVLDGKSYLKLKALAPQTELAELQEKGVSSLAVYQQNLEEFEESGSMKRVALFDPILEQASLTQKMKELNLQLENTSNSALFAITNNSLQEQIRLIKADLKENYGVQVFSTADYGFIYFPNWDKKLNDLNLGYNAQLLKEAKDLGLSIAYRSDNELNSLSVLEKNIQEIEAKFLIFDGEEITGYPNQIDKTAALMQEKQLVFGAVEAFIADQDGSRRLSQLNDYNLLRTHSMQQEEVELASTQTIIDRYLLALRERSVSIIYHKPYLEGDNLLQKNLEFLSSFKSQLNSEGYNIGDSEPAAYFSNAVIYLYLILAGVTAAGILLLNYFSQFKYSKLMNLFFPLAGLAAFLLINLGQQLLLRQIMALAAAVIFPSLAVIVFLLEKNKGGEELAGGRQLSYLFINFTAAVLTALIGGVFVSTALNSSEFIFKAADFRGVKIAFIMPLIIISIYYFIQSSSVTKIRENISDLLESVIKVKHLILAAILALAAVIYIGRTGNFPLLPVPAWELTIRSLLEKLLFVRPRFKEFLIGYPLFIFSLYLGTAKRRKLFFYPLLILASVGVITTVNTFSHLHTPVWISLIRTFHSYWLSFILGAVLILLYKTVSYLIEKYNFSGVK